MPEKVRLGFVKLGAIGVSPLIEFTLDERADREDMEVRVVGSGAKLGEQEGKDVATRLLEFNPHLAIVVSANAKLPGPTAARTILAEGGVPVVLVSDGPTKKIAEDLKKDGFGYIILESDAMIGARREFLDPVEMVWYNAVIAKVLAGTGVFNLIVRELDRVIEQLKTNKKPVLPQIIVDRNSACEAAAYVNPYAYSKAVAAYELSRLVGKLTVEGCFVEKDWEKYTKLVSAAHEIMRQAGVFVDEAREIEKTGDNVFRAPHNRSGVVLHKNKLIEKPKKP